MLCVCIFCLLFGEVYWGRTILHLPSEAQSGIAIVTVCAMGFSDFST